MKKGLIASTVFALTLGLAFAGNTIASDKGAADMVLQATVDPASKPKPAVFPHAAHQEKFACADCHHSKDADGNKVAYVEGQKIESCESCHNLAAGLEKKISTYKMAAHSLCVTCHKATDKALGSCKVCHK